MGEAILNQRKASEVRSKFLIMVLSPMFDC